MVELLTVEILQAQLAKKLKLAIGQKLEPAKLNAIQKGVYNTFLRDYALQTGMDNIHLKDGKPVIKGAILVKLAKQMADCYNLPVASENAAMVVLAKNNVFMAAPIADAQKISVQQTQAAQARLTEEAKIVEKHEAAKAARVALQNPEPAPPPPEVFQYMRVDTAMAHKENNIDFILLQMGVAPGMPEYEAKKTALKKEISHVFPQGKASKGGIGNKSAYLKIAQDGGFDFVDNPPLESNGHTVALNRNNSTKVGKLEVWQTSNDTIMPATVKIVETVLPLDRILRELAHVGAADFNKKTRAYAFFDGEQFDADIEQAVKGVLSKYPNYIAQNTTSAQVKALYEAFKKQADNPKACMVPQPKNANSLAAFETVDELDTTTRFRTDYALIERVKNFTPHVVASTPVLEVKPIDLQNHDTMAIASDSIAVEEKVVAAPEINLVDLLPDDVSAPETTLPITESLILIEEEKLKPLVLDKSRLDKVDADLVDPNVQTSQKSNLKILGSSFFNKTWKKAAAIAAGVVLVGSMVFATVNGAFKKAEPNRLKDTIKDKTTIVTKAVTPVAAVSTASIDAFKPKTVDIDNNVKPVSTSNAAVVKPVVITAKEVPTKAEPKTFGATFAQARQDFLNNKGPDTFSHKGEDGQIKKYTTDSFDAEVVVWFKDTGRELTGNQGEDHKVYLKSGREYKSIHRLAN